MDTLSGLNDGLVAYWPVNEKYTSTQSYGKTSKDYNNNIDLGIWRNGGSGQSISFINGKYSTSLSFDGIDDYAQASKIGLLKAGEPFSITLWVYQTNTGYILYTNDFSLDTPSGNWIQFTVNSNIAAYNSFPLNTWKYVTIIFDGKTIQLFVDGNLVGSFNHTFYLPVQNILYLGVQASMGGFWQGQLDEIRIYNRALSQKEIKALMDIGME
jgi:hypothetical protein